MIPRTKLMLAISVAIWMVPMTRAMAGIDVTAGDWKLDFSGNVNAFYVGANCDDGLPSQHGRRRRSGLHR